LVICLIQLAALGYGVNTVFTARPVFLVFEVDRFVAVYANEIDHEELSDIKTSLSWFGPKWLAAFLPEDDDERNDLLFQSIDKGVDLAQMPQYYAPYIDAEDSILEKSKTLDELKQFNASGLQQIEKIKKKYLETNTSVGFIPLAAKKSDLSVIINRTTSETLEIVDLRPW